MDNMELIWTFMLEYTPGWGVLQHSHDFYQMYYVVSGTSDFLLDGAPLVLKPKHCLILRPGQIHELPVVKSGCLRVLDTKFKILSWELEECILRLPQMITVDDSALEDLLLKARREWSSKLPFSTEMAELNFDQALYTFLRKNMPKGQPFFLTHAMEFIEELTGLPQKIQEYARVHYTGLFSLDALAAELRYNKNYLCKVFKQAAGFTILSYVTYLRVSKAYELICYSDDSLTEIAYNCGFSSANYFIHIFKSITGHPPMELRNQEKKAIYTDILQHGKFNYRYYSGS